MRPGRPNLSKNWPHRLHLLKTWDAIALRGQTLESAMPFKSIRWQLRSGDIKGPQDFNLAKMGLFLKELMAFDAQTGEGRLHRLLRNRRKLKRAAGRGLAPSRAYHYFSQTYTDSKVLFGLLQFFFDRFTRYVSHKQLPTVLKDSPRHGLLFEVRELTPFLSGSESLYLLHDYFDWEDVRISMTCVPRIGRFYDHYISSFRL